MANTAKEASKKFAEAYLVHEKHLLENALPAVAEDEALPATSGKELPATFIPKKTEPETPLPLSFPARRAVSFSPGPMGE